MSGRSKKQQHSTADPLLSSRLEFQEWLPLSQFTQVAFESTRLPTDSTYPSMAYSERTRDSMHQYHRGLWIIYLSQYIDICRMGRELTCRWCQATKQTPILPLNPSCSASFSTYEVTMCCLKKLQPPQGYCPHEELCIMGNYESFLGAHDEH